MVAPFLPLMLLAGNEAFKRIRKERDAEEVQQAIKAMLGVAGAPMGPEAPDGSMGAPTGGTGLLADPSNPGRQLEFAGGLAGLKGATGVRGLQMLESAFARAQQAQQFEAEQRRMAGQFQQQETSAADRFAKTFGLQQSAEERAGRGEQRDFARDVRLGDQWERQFKASQANADRSYGLAASAQELDRQRQVAQAAAAAAAGLAPPNNHTWFASADGIVAKPVPGTEPYAKGMAGERGFTDADARVGKLLDLFAGVEVEVPGGKGKKVRSGGYGTEIRGDIKAQYSTLRSQLIADVGRMQELGTLQPGDVERLTDLLPDLGATSVLSSNSAIAKTYEELRREFKGKLASHRKAYPWLVPALPPGARPVED